MTIINPNKKHLLNWHHCLYLLLFTGLLILSACDTTPQEQAGGDASVEQTLNNLGVSTDVSARSASDGEPLPDDYAPLGASEEPQKFEELLLLGWSLSGSTGHNSLVNLLELDRKDNQTFDTNSLFAPDESLTTWADVYGEDTTTLRASIGADIDDDGLEELVIVHQDGPSANVELVVYDDQVNSFASNQSLVVSTLDVTHLSINAADLNGDGYAELIIGLVTGQSLQLWIIENSLGSLSLAAEAIEIPGSFVNSEITSVIDTGNIDYDRFAEFVVVMNEYFDQSGETGASQYFVFDDLENNLVELSSGTVHAASINRTAIVSDVALGDVDGDNLDEFVFAGLTHFDPTESCAYNIVAYVLDDVEAEFESLGATEIENEIHDGCASSAGELRFVHVNTGDLDGDDIAEIQVNEFIFEDFNQYAPFSPLFDSENETAALPQTSLYASSGGFTGLFSAINSDIVIADVTANERQEVILFSQSTQKMEVWGIGEPVPEQNLIDKQWRLIHSFAIDANSDSTPIWPMLTTLNVNHDGVAISYDEGDYQLIFTEPVLIAALAGAPCFEDLGQNLDACRTSYGTSESTTVELENSLTIKAGVMVGIGVEVSDPISGIRISDIESKVKTTSSFSLSHSSAYSYTEQVSYTTGPIEDTVIFSTIPYDMYTYSISSHPDPAMIGEQLIISMPRSPITVQVERGFYNASVEHGGPLIQDSVFPHTTGQPNSYLTSAEKDQLISKYDSGESSQWAYEFGPTTVGEGGGSTSLDINIASENGTGFGIGAETELEVQGTLGVVIAGFSIGVETTSALQIVHGTESNYTGSVANLPSSSFAQNYYQWGLFSYLMDDHNSGQVFEVINYWVE